MKELKNEVLSSIEERRNLLVRASKRFVQQVEENGGVTWSADMQFMKELLEDIDRLSIITRKIAHADVVEEADEEFAKELLESKVFSLRTDAKYEYLKFVDERSFEE